MARRGKRITEAEPLPVAAADPAGLEADLGHQFNDRLLLEQALTHSAPGRSGRAPLNPAATYQRLEFLGDRVIGLVTADLLLEAFPTEPEGSLTRRLTALVSGAALADLARGLELGRYLRLDRSLDLGGGRENPTLLADAMEAVAAALYLEGGVPLARRCLGARLQAAIARDATPPVDAKTALKEVLDARRQPAPQYQLLRRSGPAHAPVFTIRAVAATGEAAEGMAGVKREAEQQAARRLLEILTAPAQAASRPGERVQP